MKKSDKAFAFTLLLLLGVCVVGVLIYAGKSGTPSVLSTFLPAPEKSVYSSEPVSPAFSGPGISSSASSPEASENESSDKSHVKTKTSSRSSSRAPASSSSERAEKFRVEENEPDQERININEATVEQLEDRLHFNHFRAMAIVEYREQNGPFESLSELLEIDQSDDLTLELLSEFFTV